MNIYGFNPDTSCKSFLTGDQQSDNYSYKNDQFVTNNDVSPFLADESFIVPYNLGSSLLPTFDPLLDPTDDVPEIPDTCFNYITDLLREEYCSSDDPFDTPNATLHDYMATQMSYNKSIDDALHLGENFSYPISDDYLNMFSSTTSHFSDVIPNHDFASSHSIMQTNNNMLNQNLGCILVGNNVPLVGPNPTSMNNEAAFGLVQNANDMNNSFCFETTLLQDQMTKVDSEVRMSGSGENFTDDSRRRKHDEGSEKESQGNGVRKNKHSALCDEQVVEQIEQYGEVILCPEGRSKPGALCRTQSSSGTSSKGSRKRGSRGQVAVDLRGLLTRCAQCVAQVDLTGAYDMLRQIRQSSSQYGDFLERVAHCLADGLEARLEGKGFELTMAHEEDVSPSEVLKANRIYVASVPFQIMSYYTMNKTIAGVIGDATSVHIIDFGINYGLQWPCIIQNLSKRPGGPPRVRITGVDFPQRGFRPWERVEETGRCLGKYCEKYNVPFEYHPVAKKWEDIELDELKIEGNEPLVVNCLYRAHLLFNDRVEDDSPREAFLKLVRRIKPDMFMHAVVNSTSSVPFFLNRFKEAMFHYSALFDIFESTMSREGNEERMLLERKLYGPQALNVIACEGVERVERPESYKQWQVRTQRAGFEQVGLDLELVKRARAMIRRSFREEFSYDEDGCWVVQGWKGRILYAISCWKPT